jgi:short-subunit dehydrogenase
VLKVVTISSIGALVSTHNSGFYSASKAALSKAIESFNLKYEEKCISFLNVTLGFVKTRATDGLSHATKLNISPETASIKIIKAINRNKQNASIPFFRNFPWLILHLSGVRFQKLFLKVLWKWMIR